jgi:hypothetical protein
MSQWGLGIGDWGLGIGDWGLANPQSPIPNPHFLIFYCFSIITTHFMLFIFILIYLKKKLKLV